MPHRAPPDEAKRRNATSFAAQRPRVGAGVGGLERLQAPAIERAPVSEKAGPASSKAF